MIAAVLHLDEGPRPTVHALDEMKRRLADGHDVVDPHLRRVAEEVAVALGVKLLLIAEDEIDLGHAGEARRVDLRRAAGDDDLRRRPFPPRPADRLARLSHRFCRDGTRVDQDGVAKPGLRRLDPHDLRLERVEAAAESEDVDRVCG